ncbi:MAG TPA: XRE family transcriptional regulator [Oscillospiraceae bacterium]|nr:XRE family transcriptional regulator [Oscillospiraceae bacterium]HPS76319.1 XRE family transcriptional regulator [Oscillospiraceae bacterium]
MSKSEKDPIGKYLEALIRARPNDAAKLAFLSPEEADKIGRLDLQLLSEIKRGAQGGMEIKLLDKAELIQKLAELRRAQEAETAEGADFYQALDRAAAQLNPPPEEAQDAL